MSTRSLSLLVLTLVLATIFTVGWYLDGARPVTAETTRSGTEPQVEHVWRTYPGAPSARRQRSTRQRLTTQNGVPAVRATSAVSPWTPVPVAPAATESTSYDSRARD